MDNNISDDGSLACLNIPEDKSNKHFNCPEITQQKLINLTFWIIDYLDDVKTKFGANRYLVKIKFNLEDRDSDARKFFTNSQEIKYVLRKSIKKRMFQKAGVLRRHSPEMAKPHIAAWWGWMKYGDCRNLSRKLLNRFEYEIKFN